MIKLQKKSRSERKAAARKGQVFAQKFSQLPQWLRTGWNMPYVPTPHDDTTNIERGDKKIDSVNMKVCNDENIHDVKQTFVHDTAAGQGPSDLNNFDLKANNLQTPKSDISSKLNTKEQVRQVLDTLAIKDSPLLKSVGLVGRAERLIEKKLKAFVGEGGAQVGDSGHAEVELRLKPSAKVPQAKSRPLNPLM